MLKTYYILTFIILLCFGVKANEYEIKNSKFNKFKRGAAAAALLQSVKVDATVDVNSLVDTVIDESKNAIKIVFTPTEVTDITPEKGGRWISINAKQSGHVFSAYYHPTKRHYARAIGKTDPGRSYAGPGEWAIAVVPRKIMGNKTNYGVCEDDESENKEPEIDNESVNDGQLNTTNQNGKQEQTAGNDLNNSNQEQAVGNNLNKDTENIPKDELVTDGIESLKCFSFYNILLIMTLWIYILF